MEELAATIVTVVSPYLVVGATAYAKAVGESAADATAGLVSRLKDWWSADEVANAAASELAADPARHSRVLAELLAQALEDDPALADELRGLVAAIGPSVSVAQRIEIAQGVTGADIKEMLTGDVRVKQELGEATDVTGVRIDRLGG